MEHFFGSLLLLAIAVQCFSRQQTGKDAAELYVIADEIHWVFKIKGLKGYHFSALPHTYHVQHAIYFPPTLNCEIINSTSVYLEKLAWNAMNKVPKVPVLSNCSRSSSRISKNTLNHFGLRHFIDHFPVLRFAATCPCAGVRSLLLGFVGVPPREP